MYIELKKEEEQGEGRKVCTIISFVVRLSLLRIFKNLNPQNHRSITCTVCASATASFNAHTHTKRFTKTRRKKEKKNTLSQLLPIDNCDNIISVSFSLIHIVGCCCLSFSLCNNWIIVRAQTGKIDDEVSDDAAAAADDEDYIYVCYAYKRTNMRQIQNSKILYREQVKPALPLSPFDAFSLIREK